MLPTRTGRARSVDKKAWSCPASARRSRVLATRGCRSPWAERIRPSLVRREWVTEADLRSWEGTRADYPDLGSAGQGEVVNVVVRTSRRERLPHGTRHRLGHCRGLLAHAALRLRSAPAGAASPGAGGAGDRSR